MREVCLFSFLPKGLRGIPIFGMKRFNKIKLTDTIANAHPATIALPVHCPVCLPHDATPFYPDRPATTICRAVVAGVYSAVPVADFSAARKHDRLSLGAVRPRDLGASSDS